MDRSAGTTFPVANPDQVVQNYTIDHSTAGAKAIKHEVLNLKDGSRKRMITHSVDGTTEYTVAADLSESGSYAGRYNAQSWTLGRRPGRHHRIDTVLPARLGTLSAGRTVNRGNPFDLLDVQSVTTCASPKLIAGRSTAMSDKSRH